MTNQSIRDKMAALPPEEQERRILACFDEFGGEMTRDWFAVELRAAFDRLVANGTIVPTKTYQRACEQPVSKEG